jgi:hypothetical protein
VKLKNISNLIDYLYIKKWWGRNWKNICNLIDIDWKMLVWNWKIFIMIKLILKKKKIAIKRIQTKCEGKRNWRGWYEIL